MNTTTVTEQVRALGQRWVAAEVAADVATLEVLVRRGDDWRLAHLQLSLRAPPGPPR